MHHSTSALVCSALLTLTGSALLAQNAVPLQIADEDVVNIGPAQGAATKTAGYQYEHEFHSPGSSYIKLHFKKFNLAKGDYVEVLNAYTGESQVYAEQGKIVDGGEHMISDFWTGSVLADKAVVRLWSSGLSKDNGFKIDRVAYGYPEEQIEAMVVKSLCGTDDKEQVICYNGTTMYTKAMAVCRIVINGGSLCTGWLLGSEGHVMTNNHCIGTAAAAQNTDFQFNYENTNCAGTLNAVTDQVASTSTLICTDANLDYTLVQLPVNPTATYGYLSFRSTAPIVGERIYIPQHPGGRRKEIAVNDDQQGSGLAEIVGNGNRVEYLCDTEGGSSGSPVLGFNDNLVVALHNTGGCNNGGNRNNNIINDMGSCLPMNAVGSVTAPPVADFSSSVNCRTVSFMDLSTNFPNAWAWDFGDGNTSSSPNPSHTYAGYGTYTVTLVATNSIGSDTQTIPNGITLAADPAPIVDTVTQCGTGSATLVAQGATLFYWYSDAAGNNLISTSVNFTTGPVSADTTFYVGTTGACASSLTPSVVSVASVQGPDSTLGASGCVGDVLNLQAFGANDLVWYDQPTGGTPLITSANFSTPPLITSQTYYVSSSLGTQAIEQVGPVDGSFGAGSHQNFTNRLVFDALSDVTIVSAWMDAGSAGNRDIEVFDNNGISVDIVTVFIPAGQSRVTLNLDVPQGNDYEIGITGTIIDLFRNNAGVSFPYTSNNVEITSSTAATPGAFYYYFYDWEVSVGAQCESNRVPVAATINPDPTVTAILAGNVLDAGAGFSGYQWYFNGNIIPGATSQTYTANNDGDYYCIATDTNGCDGTSNTVAVISTGIIQLDQTGFALWPNPSNGSVMVTTAIPSGSYELLTVTGQVMKAGSFMGSFEIETSELIEGTYLVRLIDEQERFVERVVVY